MYNKKKNGGEAHVVATVGFGFLFFFFSIFRIPLLINGLKPTRSVIYWYSINATVRDTCVRAPLYTSVYNFTTDPETIIIYASPPNGATRGKYVLGFRFHKGRPILYRMCLPTHIIYIYMCTDILYPRTCRLLFVYTCCTYRFIFFFFFYRVSRCRRDEKYYYFARFVPATPSRFVFEPPGPDRVIKTFA